MAKEKSRGKKQKAQTASASSTESLGGRVSQFREFLEQSKSELKKVTWPSRKETMVTSFAVVAFTVVMAIYLGLVDVALAKIVEAILS